MWEGVVCNNLTGHVLQLHLQQSGLQGKLNPSLLKLDVLELGSWNLGGDRNRIPTWLETQKGYISALDLSNIGISFPVPSWFWEMTEYLNLSRNHLHGNIPADVIIGAILIDLSSNLFNGSLPRLAKKVIMLDLSNNSFSGGELPADDDCWMKWQSLAYLNIGSNNISDNIFSGKIPRCISNFTAMATKRWFGVMVGNGVIDYTFRYRGNLIESAYVATKGTEHHYDTILYLVTNIDLSRNNLSGEIPKEITSLAELRSLNLSQNHFTGLIPYGIGDMKQLESLDLSRNSLSGEIPNSITVLSSLNYMNVSYNNLTGRIPESTQLRSLNESSFIGNKLCGPPLTSGCSNDKVHAPGFYYHKEDGGKKWEIDWFYIFLTLGYVVGFSAVCNALIFIKSWRDAYFGWLENMWNKLCVYTSRRRCLSTS
ncbi:hypothetical protein RD792_006515 [Penstemon davidsonii]|uniref:Uncharacterized protein n=1 Tax=Penstemon davidsonii TaxID=160366 RepID=A0ABR0DEB0_9LAMI|nr:hypothetical protein RD792_006515 [Penstemon davidsonii]